MKELDYKVTIGFEHGGVVEIGDVGDWEFKMGIKAALRSRGIKDLKAGTID